MRFGTYSNYPFNIWHLLSYEQVMNNGQCPDFSDFRYIRRIEAQPEQAFEGMNGIRNENRNDLKRCAMAASASGWRTFLASFVETGFKDRLMPLYFVFAKIFR